MTDMTPQLFTELIAATYAFGDAYHEADTAKKASDTAKSDFYTKADEALSLRRLAQKSIQVKSGDEVSKHVADYYPGWRPVSSDPSQDEGMIDVIIEQDPAQMKFSFTNLEDGHHYQRSYQEGNPQLDEERLQEEDPDLYDSLHTWPPPPSWLFAFAKGFDANADEDNVRYDWYDFMENGTHDIEPVLKPTSEWTQEEKNAVGPYLVPGKRTMKIVKPRKATEEEVQEAIDLLEELAGE